MPKRGENIYKRKDGRWEGRYIRGHSPSGRAEYGYVYASSYRECRTKRQKCLDTCQKAPMKASSLTLDQAAERFLADKQDKLKQSTLARYAYMLEHYILPAFGAILICQLTANQISDFLLRLQKGGLSGKSARDVGVLLKSILRYSAKKLDCTVRGWPWSCLHIDESRSTSSIRMKFSVWRRRSWTSRRPPVSAFC